MYKLTPDLENEFGSIGTLCFDYIHVRRPTRTEIDNRHSKTVFLVAYWRMFVESSASSTGREW